MSTLNLLHNDILIKSFPSSPSPIILGRGSRSSRETKSILSPLFRSEGTKVMSQSHCKLYWDNHIPFLMDLESTNGTWVKELPRDDDDGEGKRLLPNVGYRIKDGTIITFGKEMNGPTGICRPISLEASISTLLSPPPSRQPSKVIEVIQLDDSDSDNSDMDIEGGSEYEPSSPTKKPLTTSSKSFGMGLLSTSASENENEEEDEDELPQEVPSSESLWDQVKKQYRPNTSLSLSPPPHIRFTVEYSRSVPPPSPLLLRLSPFPSSSQLDPSSTQSGDFNNLDISSKWDWGDSSEVDAEEEDDDRNQEFEEKKKARLPSPISPEQLPSTSSSSTKFTPTNPFPQFDEDDIEGFSQDDDFITNRGPSFASGSNQEDELLVEEEGINPPSLYLPPSPPLELEEPLEGTGYSLESPHWFPSSPFEEEEPEIDIEEMLDGLEENEIDGLDEVERDDFFVDRDAKEEEEVDMDLESEIEVEEVDEVVAVEFEGEVEEVVGPDEVVFTVAEEGTNEVDIPVVEETEVTTATTEIIEENKVEVTTEITQIQFETTDPLPLPTTTHDPEDLVEPSTLSAEAETQTSPRPLKRSLSSILNDDSSSPQPEFTFEEIVTSNTNRILERPIKKLPKRSRIEAIRSKAVVFLAGVLVTVVGFGVLEGALED